MGHRQWTPAEIGIVIEGYALHDTPEAIASRLPGRSVGSIKHEACGLCLVMTAPRISRSLEG